MDANVTEIGRHRLRKTTLLNALVSLLPAGGRIVSIEDTLELRLRRANCLRWKRAGSPAAT